MATDSYAQPKRALSGGFMKQYVLTAAAVTQDMVVPPVTEPSDYPMKHYVHVQKLHVLCTTGSAAKTWQFRAKTTTGQLLTHALDMATTGNKYDFDFGPQGFKLPLGETMEVLISAAGAAGDIEIEGFFERSHTEIPTLFGVIPQSGPAAGGTQVELEGVAFKAGMTVSFGIGNAATLVKVYAGGHRASCKTPAVAAGAVDVIFTNLDATTATKTNGFTFV